MKRRHKVVLCFGMSLSMIATALPVASTVYALDNPVTITESVDRVPVSAPSVATIHKDAIYDAWSFENTTVSPSQQNELVFSGNRFWRHIKASEQNDNNSNPAVLVNATAGDVDRGHWEFDIQTLSPQAETRAGIYLRYASVSQSVFVGFDRGGWFWQVYNGSDNPWYSGNRIAAPAPGTTVRVTVDIDDNNRLTATVNGQSAFSDPVDISSVPNAGKTAFKAATFNSNVSNILISNVSYPAQAEAQENMVVSGTVTDAQGQVVSDVTVTTNTGASVTTDSSGVYTFPAMLPQRLNLTFEKAGFRTQKVQTVSENATAHTQDVVLEVERPSSDWPALDASHVIASDDMEVQLADNFPRVIAYRMKATQKVLLGNTNPVNTLKINNVSVQPSILSVEKSADRTEYKLGVQNGALNVELTVLVNVEKNALKFEVTEVKNLNQSPSTNDEIVRFIEFNDLNPVSIRSSEAGAAFAGGNMSNHTTVSGDTFYRLTSSTPVGSNPYWIAAINNDALAASMWTSSRGVGAGEDGKLPNWANTLASVRENNGEKVLSLNSAKWTYQRGLNYRKEDANELNEYKTIEAGTVGRNPQFCVVITDNINDDNMVNWNDALLALAQVKPRRFGHNLVPDTVAIRISMNFGSMAQNPFLKTLDNLKKVYLNTDGLGQNILLKGYGSEGHDSGHLDYADIGHRIGGAEDMKTLMAEGHKYGAIFGVHVNASETYPESKYFLPERMNGSSKSWSFGWNWIDQGININGDYDLKHNRVDRFRDFAKALEKADGTNDLDYVYVDVWGNGQSGDNDTWASGMLAKEILSQGWAVAGEWSDANAYDAIFQHWAADTGYGGYSKKGINSQIIRFLENGERDSWPSNHLPYGGGDAVPLYGGYKMVDFEGWQGRNNYDSYMRQLWHFNLPTKFLQHYQTTETVISDLASPMTINENVNFTWKPEMKLVLKSDNGFGSDKIVVTRGSDDYVGNRDAYLTRTMTFNGTKVLEEKGDRSIKYLLPWFWDENGNKLQQADEKLYFFSTDATANETWTLPSHFANETSLKMYRLTDLGKVELQEVPVSSGTISITAQANQAYVLLRQEKVNPVVEWGTGTGIKDPGFNSYSLDAWTTGGNTDANILRVENTASGNPVLKITDNTEDTWIRQTLTNLEPNQRYAIYLGVENRSNSKAYIKVLNGSDVLDENYTRRSVAKNYIKAYAHNTNHESFTINGTSYFQDMYVFFTAPDTGSVDLLIGKEDGTGTAYFDDVRLVKTKMNTFVDENQEVFVQDFENNVAGVYPFVIGNGESVEDNRQHLSELHAPYTNRGWDDLKFVSDVIEGGWSFKVNGLNDKNTILFQTIPQNYRFEPGKTYRVDFDYLAGSSGIYEFIGFDGAWENSPRILFRQPLAETISNPKDKEANHLGLNFTVPQDAQHFCVAVFSTRVEPQTLPGKHVNFSGVKDMVLDNLVIRKFDSQDAVNFNLNRDTLNQLILKADKIDKSFYSRKTVNNLNSRLTAAKITLKSAITQSQLDKATETLSQAIENLVLKDIDNKVKVTEVDTNSFQSGSSEGPAILAFDGSPSTFWHSEWGGHPYPIWISAKLNKSLPLKKLTYVPRPEGQNGIITAWRIELSDDGTTWTTAKTGTWAADNRRKDVVFDANTNAQYVKLVATAGVGGFASAAEIIIERQPIDVKAAFAEMVELQITEAEAKLADRANYVSADMKTLETVLAQAKALNTDSSIDDYKNVAKHLIMANTGSLLNSEVPSTSNTATSPDALANVTLKFKSDDQVNTVKVRNWQTLRDIEIPSAKAITGKSFYRYVDESTKKVLPKDMASFEALTADKTYVAEYLDLTGSKTQPDNFQLVDTDTYTLGGTTSYKNELEYLQDRENRDTSWVSPVNSENVEIVYNFKTPTNVSGFYIKPLFQEAQDANHVVKDFAIYVNDETKPIIKASIDYKGVYTDKTYVSLPQTVQASKLRFEVLGTKADLLASNYAQIDTMRLYTGAIPSPTATPIPTNTPEPTVTPVKAVLNGWHVVKGHVRYYVNDVPVKGVQTIGKTTYLFDAQGNQQRGWHVIGGVGMYFNPVNGGRWTGLRTIGKTTYLLDAKRGKLTGWHVINGVEMYFDMQNGGRRTGLVKTHTGVYYLLSSRKGKLKGWHLINGKAMYFSSVNGARLRVK